MGKKNSLPIASIRTPGRLVKALLFGFGQKDERWLAMQRLHTEFDDWCQTPEGVKAFATVLHDDGNELAPAVWATIGNAPLDTADLCRIAGGCEVDTAVADEALDRLLERQPNNRTLARLYCTAYRSFTTFMVSYELTARLPAPTMTLLNAARGLLADTHGHGIGYYANSSQPIRRDYLRSLHGEARPIVFRRQPVGPVKLADLTNVGLLVLALVGDDSTAACAACQLFMRTNAGDGIHDFAKELCHPL